MTIRNPFGITNGFAPYRTLNRDTVSAASEYMVAGGDGDFIVLYDISDDTLNEVDRITIPSPRNQVLAAHFIGDVLWFVSASTSFPRDNYLSSVSISGGQFGLITEHVVTGTSSTAAYSISSSGNVLAVLNGSQNTLYRFDVSTGTPVQTHMITTAGDARYVTFCGTSDQYIAYTTGNGNTLELVNAADLTSVDSYAGRGLGLAAHRGTDVIFATGTFGGHDAISVAGGTITLLATGPRSGSGNLIWLTNRGELWSGEYYAPWDGSTWGTRSSVGIGPTRLQAVGVAEQRIGVVRPTRTDGTVDLWRTDGTLADTIAGVLSGRGRAVAITGGSPPSGSQ